MTKSIDPRQGLHRQLNLLEAYQVYEKDYPLFLPDISATLALKKPFVQSHRRDPNATELKQERLRTR